MALSNDPWQPPATDPSVAAGDDLAPEPFTGGARAVVRGLQLYFRHFPQIALVVCCTTGALNVASFVFAGAASLGDGQTVLTLVGVLVDPLADMAILFSVVETVRTGAAPGLGRALGYGVGRWGRALGVAIAAGFLTALASLAFIVPGIVLALGYAFTAQVVALEHDQFSGALGRSRDLALGRRWQMFGAFALAGVPYFALMFVPALLVPRYLPGTLAPALLALAGSLLSPALSMIGLVMYVDIAHEGDPAWTSKVRWAPAPAEDAQAAPAP